MMIGFLVATIVAVLMLAAWFWYKYLYSGGERRADMEMAGTLNPVIILANDKKHFDHTPKMKEIEVVKASKNRIVTEFIPFGHRKNAMACKEVLDGAEKLINQKFEHNKQKMQQRTMSCIFGNAKQGVSLAASCLKSLSSIDEGAAIAKPQTERVPSLDKQLSPSSFLATFDDKGHKRPVCSTQIKLAMEGLQKELELAKAQAYYWQKDSVLRTLDKMGKKNVYQDALRKIKEEPGWEDFVSTVKFWENSGDGLPLEMCDEQAQTISRLDSLYYASMETQQSLMMLIMEIVNSTGLNVSMHKQINSTKPKSMYRAFEKTALNKNPEHQYRSGNIYDMCRATLICNDMNQVTDVLTQIMAPDSGILIVRVKNRFQKPTGGGWADFMLNVTLNSDTFHTICEIQVSHIAMTAMREGLTHSGTDEADINKQAIAGHKQYENYRNALEIAEYYGWL